MNGDNQTDILSGIQIILDSIPNLKQTLISLKEGAIVNLNPDLHSDYPNRLRYYITYIKGMEISYSIPDDVHSVDELNRYINDKGGDTYNIIYNRFPPGVGPGRDPIRTLVATILIKNGVNSLANANTLKASKNSIRINLQGGGRRRKYTKKARKSRRRSRKHRS